MRSHLLGLSMVLFLIGPGCLSSNPARNPIEPVETPLGADAFRVRPVSVDQQGSEPSLAIGPDGSMIVCSPRGLGYGSDVWVSPDGNASFQSVGTNLSYELPVVRSGGGDLGGGDCNVGFDAGGRVYLVDLWEAGVSVASSADHGATWRGVPLSIIGAPLDRPWVLGGQKDEVFVTAAQIQGTGFDTDGLDGPPVGGIWVARSTDGGLTFPQRVLAVSNDHRLGLNSNLAQDDLNLYLMYTKKTGPGRFVVMVAVSGDRGATWEQRIVAEQDYYDRECFAPFNVFPVVATDGAGGVYLAWSLDNPHTQRPDLFMLSSPDHGKTWNKPVMIVDRPGSRYYPWIAAKGPGQVGLVWYETNASILPHTTTTHSCGDNAPPKPAWYIHYAFSDDALATTPHFHDTLVQPNPIHIGPLSEEPRMEVLQMRFTQDGRPATTYIGDTPEGNGRAIFAIQTASS